MAYGKRPTLLPDRALKAIAEQLEVLQTLKGRRYDEASAAEME